MFTQTFAHRPTSEDSYDSICTNCFSTAASDMTEEELKVVEKKHVCNPGVVERLMRDTAA